MTENLWPEDLAAGIEPDSPFIILREQAEALAIRTNGRLRAEVETSPVNDKLALNFVLVAPALDDYRYRLFKVWPEKDIDPYPVTLMLASDDQRPADTPDKFRDVLREIFSSPATRRAIAELLEYSSPSSSISARAAA